MRLKGEVALWVMHACFGGFFSKQCRSLDFFFFSIKGEPFFHYVMVFLEIFCIKFLPLSRNKGFFFVFSEIAPYWPVSCETCSSSVRVIIPSLQKHVRLKQDNIFGINAIGTGVNPQESSRCFLPFPAHNFGALGVDATIPDQRQLV